MEIFDFHGRFIKEFSHSYPKNDINNIETTLQIITWKLYSLIRCKHKHDQGAKNHDQISKQLRSAFDFADSYREFLTNEQRGIIDRELGRTPKLEEPDTLEICRSAFHNMHLNLLILTRCENIES